MAVNTYGSFMLFAGAVVGFSMIPVCYVFERWLPFLIGRSGKKARKEEKK